MSQSTFPTLVLLPGLACDGGLFEGLMPALRGWGSVHVSDAHTRGATLPEMARLLWAECDAAGAETAVLVGCSMGGMLALEAHRQAPQRVAGIGLLGTTARADTPDVRALRQQAIERFAAGQMHEVLRKNVPYAFHPSHAGDAALIGAYIAMIERAGAPQLIAQNQAVMARADLRGHLPQVHCPVLVAVGEADVLTPPEQAREMAQALPQARLHVLAGAGHMLTMEQPAALAALLLDWLRGAVLQRR